MDLDEKEPDIFSCLESMSEYNQMQTLDLMILYHRVIIGQT